MKVEIRSRFDNEKGLFAVENIKKGEFICILPIDYFQLDGNWYVTSKDNLENKINFRYGILCDIKMDKNKTELENFNFFYKKKKRKWCILNKYSEIIGISNNHKTDENFIGHMINDYVDMLFLTKNKYENLSKEFSNVEVFPKLHVFGERLGLKINASKYIKKGNELYMSYGSNYWTKYSGKKDFIYNVKLNIIR